MQYVGIDWAHRHGVAEVAALFIDLVGSTALAARRSPEEVVSLLNRFFVVVVDVVEEHGPPSRS